MHVCNDALTDVEGQGKLYLYDFEANEDKLCREFSFSVAQNGVAAAYECDYADLASAMTPTTVLLCDVASTLGEDTALFIPDRFRDLAIEYGSVRSLGETDKEITVTTDTFLPYAMIDVPYLLSDNCFVLKKGEVKTLQKIRAI